MAKANDERIMQLKKQADEKKKSLALKSMRFSPVTNCVLKLDGQVYNIHAMDSEYLLVKLNALAMSAKDLGLDTSKFVLSGYSLDAWMEDVRNCMKVREYNKEKAELASLEKRLDKLLSDDKRTELELDDIAALLN